MKKNLRIVSAAAAALLAVAPVAATAIQPATVSADIDSNSGNTNTNVAASNAAALGNLPEAHFSNPASYSNNSITSGELQQMKVVPEGFEARNNAVVSSSKTSENGVYNQTLQFTLYWPENNNKKFTKPSVEINNKTYFFSKKAQEGNKTVYYGYLLSAAGDKESNAQIFSATRKVSGVNEQGTPYWYLRNGNNTGTALEATYNADRTQSTANGSIQFNGNVKADGELVSTGAATFTPQDLVNKILAKYDYAHNAGHAQVTPVTTDGDIEQQLINQNVKRTADGKFDYPQQDFSIQYTVKSENGKTATLNVKVNTNGFNVNYPTFEVAGKRYVNGTSINVPYTFKWSNVSAFDAWLNNGVLNGKEVGLKAFVSGHLNSDKRTIDDKDIHIDGSAVNTSVPGVYPVVVSATNPYGNTSKITFYVYSGNINPAKDMYVTGETTVVNINGNAVSNTNTKLANGQEVKAFDTIFVNGKSYTRINKADSNEFVEAKNLSDAKPSTTPSAVAQTGSKKVMWKSYVYDQNAKRVGDKTISAYETIPVYGTKTINGKTYYRVSATAEEYVNANNIDGTSRKVSHNAYVYKNNGKAYTYKKTVKKGKKHVKKTYKKLVKKGESVTTFGTTKTINGKKYYRVGYNKYIKVANFNK